MCASTPSVPLTRCATQIDYCETSSGVCQNCVGYGCQSADNAGRNGVICQLPTELGCVT